MDMKSLGNVMLSNMYHAYWKTHSSMSHEIPGLLIFFLFFFLPGTESDYKLDHLYRVLIN